MVGGEGGWSCLGVFLFVSCYTFLLFGGEVCVRMYVF